MWISLTAGLVAGLVADCVEVMTPLAASLGGEMASDSTPELTD